MKKILIVVMMCMFLIGIYGCTTNNNFVNKIVYELISGNTAQSLSSSGEVEVSNEIIVQVKLEYEDFTEVSNSNVEDQEEYRDEAKEYYQKLNKKYLSSINLTNYKSVYISKYAPYIEYVYETDKYYSNQSNIYNLINRNDYIQEAYIKNTKFQKVEQTHNAMKIAGAYEQYQNGYYSGAGIKVGILEPGLVDPNAACFSPYQVENHIQDTPLEHIDDHTTYMAAYIGGVDGVASNVKIYSSYLWGTPTEEIEWLLDNGVNVINMSYGDANPTGYYESDSAYFDMIVNQYKITMVGAVGNYGGTNKLVANPALAYNVIGVGSGNEEGYPDYFSSYIEHSGGPKPTILAKGSSVALRSLGVGNSGTSVSCAIVTGIIALLMEEFTELKTRPELVFSSLVSGAYQTPDAILMDNGLHEVTGAGLIRYDGFRFAIRGYEYLSTNIGVLQTVIYTRTMELSANEIFKVCLAWTAYTNGSVSSLKLTNYDLYLYDENNNLVASSCSTDSNIELIQVFIDHDGIYTLKIKEVTFVAKLNEKIALTFSLMPDRIDI